MKLWSEMSTLCFLKNAANACDAKDAADVANESEPEACLDDKSLTQW